MRIRDFFSDRASYAQQQLSASRISRDNQEKIIQFYSYSILNLLTLGINIQCLPQG